MITNRLGLPAPYARAAERAWRERDRDDADFTVTELDSPPQQLRLRQEYGDALEVDVADLVWLVMGKALHQVLHDAGMALTDILQEHRLRTAVVVDGVSYSVSGQPDLLSLDGARDLGDWKLTKTTAMSGEKPKPKPEWIAQVNLYGYLAWLHQLAPASLTIYVVLKDWSPTWARHRAASGYPQTPIVPLPIEEIWTDAQCRAHIEDRISRHVAARTTVPRCTDEERWKQARWAVKKSPTAKRAMNGGLHNTLEAAQAFAASAGGIIEARSGLAVRCLDWCPVRSVCPQARADAEEEGEA